MTSTNNQLPEWPYVIGPCGCLGYVQPRTRQLLPVLGVRQTIDPTLRQMLPPERCARYEEPYFLPDESLYLPDINLPTCDLAPRPQVVG
jgi:hypothetical protein